MNHTLPPGQASRQPGASENGAINDALPFDPAAKPIWEIFDQMLSEMPADERNKLPVDAAEKHDQYISGLAKRLP
jgi:hypothetical protein